MLGRPQWLHPPLFHAFLLPSQSKGHHDTSCWDGPSPPCSRFPRNPLFPPLPLQSSVSSLLLCLPSPYNGNKLPSLGNSHLHPPCAVLFVSHSTTSRGVPLDSRWSISTPTALLTRFVKITHDRPTSYSRLSPCPQSYCTWPLRGSALPIAS